MRRLRGLALLALLPLAACVTTRPPERTPVTPASVTRSAPASAARKAPPAAPSAIARNSASGKRPQVRITEPHLKDGPPDPDEIPPGIELTPDAVPRPEPRSASGNPAEYEAFGELYRVLESSQGFSERGRASWYGKKFHGKTTASGEPYDMFAMTAAHKTLPIPSYVRVTNLDNGKTAVVRVNDRGPFHSNRVIDLSYAAAARLDVIGHGHVTVELVAVEPSGDAPIFASAPSSAPMRLANQRWLQVAAYSNVANAYATRDALTRQGVRDVDVRLSPGGALHRVVVGPLNDEREVSRARARLNDAGYAAFPLRD